MRSEELKQRVDWLGFWYSQFPQMRSGGAWRQVRCCFHEDHRPSMSINVEMGAWKCHACGAGGDGIRFLMKRDGLEFKEAVKLLEQEYC